MTSAKKAELRPADSTKRDVAFSCQLSTLLCSWFKTLVTFLLVWDSPKRSLTTNQLFLVYSRIEKYPSFSKETDHMKNSFHSKTTCPDY